MKSMVKSYLCVNLIRVCIYPLGEMLVIGKARVIAHVDLDYFFAQCEERENPTYKDKPVVICVYSARGGDSGAVSTANYIARKFGVKSGMPIVLAKRLLKDEDAVFLPVNHEFYRGISGEIMNILRGYTDKFEQESIDEAYLDVTERVEHNFYYAKALALEIKNKILDEERLTCSIGVAPNKLVAKIAAGFQKPDGLTVVHSEDVKSFLSSLPIGKLYGVGHKTEEMMLELGIKTIGDLAQCRAEDLTKIFGVKLGAYFQEAANGIDESPVQERSIAQIGRITTLKEDTRTVSDVIKELDRLCEDVHKRITSGSFRFRSIGIMIVAENMSIHSRTKTLNLYTNDSEVLREVSHELFERFLKESPLKIRRIGVSVTELNSAFAQRSLSEYG